MGIVKVMEGKAEGGSTALIIQPKDLILQMRNEYFSSGVNNFL